MQPRINHVHRSDTPAPVGDAGRGVEYTLSDYPKGDGLIVMLWRLSNLRPNRDDLHSRLSIYRQGIELLDINVAPTTLLHQLICAAIDSDGVEYLPLFDHLQDIGILTPSLLEAATPC